MINPMFLGDCLSGLNLRLRFRKSGRPRRRRVSHRFRLQVGAEVSVLEERCLMTTYQGIPVPASLLNGANTTQADWQNNKLLYAFSNPAAGTLDPSYSEKTVTITNNSPDQVVYPFLLDANSGQTDLGAKYPGTPTYDPYDNYNQQYRGYIGYVGTDGKNYLGLLPGQTITVNVPLVFWDGGRIDIATDGADLLGMSPTDQANPYYFYFNSPDENNIGSTTPGSDTLTFPAIFQKGQQGPVTLTPPTLVPGMVVTGPGILDGTTILSLGTVPGQIQLSQNATRAPGGLPAQTNASYVFKFAAGSQPKTNTWTVPSIQAKGSITNGTIMWYHALKAIGPANDAPQQLTEETFRGTYLQTLPTAQPPYSLIPTSEDGTNFVNYDVSYVDAMMLPVAIEATNVQVPYNNNNNGAGAAFGWVGSSQTIQQMQGAIENFTSSNSTATITAANWTSRGGVTITAMNTFMAGQTVFIAGMTPTGYNGSLTINSATSSNFTYSLATDPGTATGFGTASVTNGLGSSFSGAGYPKYFDPNPSDINLPSGQNLLGQSPYNGTPSNYPFLATYNNTAYNLGFQYMLTSAGPGPIYVTAGSNNLNTSHASYLYFDPDPRYIATLQTIQAGLAMGQEYDVTSSGNDLPAGVVTKVTDVKFDVNVEGRTVEEVDLSQTTVGTPNPNGNVYTFTRKITDTPATSVMNLWYAWANYYATTGYLNLNPKAAAQNDLAGSVAANILTLNNAVDTLVPGMLVTGGGLAPADGCTILSIGADHKTITLSQVPSGSGSYSFALPSLAQIAGSTDPIVDPLADKLSFATNDDQANQFSEVAYEVMRVMSTIPIPPAAPGAQQPPASVSMLFNVIGCSTGQLKNINSAIDSTITNMVKSLLRGVPNFLADPYKSPSTWYPDPSVPTGNLTFNAYNLDPFVWFVHEKLGLSGYGFSVDDDTSDVGAPGATSLQMAIGGVKGLTNQNEWTLVTPFGPVTGILGVVGPKGNTIDFTDTPNAPNGLVVYAGVLGAGGAQVNGMGVPPNTTVASVTYDSSKKVCTVTVNNQLGKGNGTYYFFGPVVATGTVVLGGNTISGLSQAAFNTLQAIGPLDTSNILVSGPGIQPGTTVKDVKKINGVYTVILSNPLGDPLTDVPTSLGYTFSTS